MAPSGPRAQRNTRNPSAPTKPGGRSGGIKKRGAGGPVRTDRDGDLDMDAPAAKGGAGRGNRPPNTNGTSAPPTGPRRSTRSAPAGGRAPKPTTRAADMVKKIVESGGSGNLSSRIAAGRDTSSRHTRSRPVNGVDRVTLVVRGLKESKASSNDGGGLRDLLIFLERKAATVGKLHRTVKINKSTMKGDLVYITANKEDAEEIKKINGFEFASARLSIEELPEGTSPGLSEQSQSLKDQLTTVLGQRYNQESKLMNLSDLGQDPILQQMGMFNQATPEKVFRALMVILEDNFKTAQAKREGIHSVSLAGNNIDDVHQIMSLADALPDLLNLDLSRNMFKDAKALRKWSHRLRKLEALYLSDNPVGTDASAMAEITKLFPRLQNLSGVQVRTKEEVEAASRAPRVFPIPQFGTDFRDLNRVGEGFVTEFFALYDTDRQTLAAKFYDEQSTFSFSVMTSSAHIPNAPPLTWSSYIRLSRNHVRITHPPSRYQRLFVGGPLVQDAWSKLPLTRHPSLTVEFDKYLIDCHPMSGLADPTGSELGGVEGMIITMHGEFEDQDPETKVTSKRSFSRTFVIGPGFPGRNPIRVVSDLLQLRAYSPLPPQTGVPEGIQTSAAPVANAPINPVATQEQMAIELSKQTGMTLDYSKMCLDAAQYNLERALATFNEMRAQLPAEAFAQPIA
ncbi:hypothetical protein JX266_008293 [Neoarthrinium moseri]|nr:hypothetical protein JX266_008293 [Neoarthrinium moseri]